MMAHTPRFNPYSISKQTQQEQRTHDTDPTVELFEAKQCCLHRYLAIKLFERDMGDPIAYIIQIAAQQPEIILLQVAHPASQDGVSQWNCNTGTNKAQHTESLKKYWKGTLLAT